MNNEYVPLIDFQLETFPKTKKDLINELNEKIAYYKKQKPNTNLNNYLNKISSGVNWLESLSDNSIPELNNLEYYKLGFTPANIYSLQVWQKHNKEKISVKKKIIKISE